MSEVYSLESKRVEFLTTAIEKLRADALRALHLLNDGHIEAAKTVLHGMIMGDK